MRAASLSFWLVAIVGASHSVAFEPAPVLTVENTVGAWVTMSRSCTHYRLVLDGHGGGRFGYKATGLGVKSYSVVALTIDQYDIRIRLKGPGPKGEELELYGDGTPRYLTLHSKPFFGKETLRFVPDVEWRENDNALRSALPAVAP